MQVLHRRPHGILHLLPCGDVPIRLQDQPSSVSLKELVTAFDNDLVAVTGRMAHFPGPLLVMEERCVERSKRQPDVPYGAVRD